VKQTHSNAVIGSDKYGDWAQKCLSCHEPHHNNGITKDGGVVDPSYVLAEFTGNFAVTANGVTTMTMSGLTVHDSDWADLTTWGSKTSADRGLVLLDTINGDMFWYKIISADGSSISFINDGTYFPQSPINNPQAMSVAYGQFIRDEIRFWDPDANNGSGEFIPIETELLDENGQPYTYHGEMTFTGPTVMAENDGLAGDLDGDGENDDLTPNGVCQVCHSQTLFWRKDGSRADHFSGQQCTVCHEHEQGFKAKGGDCASCHLTTDPDTNDYTFGNGIFAAVNENEWHSTGHGLDNGSTYTVSGNSGAGLSCNYCHDFASSHDDPTNPLRLTNIIGANGVNSVCLVCHATGATGYQPPDDDSGSYPLINGSVEVDAFHFGLRHTGNNGGGFCWDCHDPHGDSNIYMIHDRVSSETDGVNGIPVSTSNVTFTDASTGRDYALDSAPYDGICQACHSNTSHYTSDYGDDHNFNMKCTRCHHHNGGSESNAFRRPGPPVVDRYALRSHDGVRIWEQLSETDIITLNGHVYRAGPAYSPKATCGSCHDYDAITRAYHFREGTGPNGEGASDHWSDKEKDGTLYKYLANAYGHLRSPGQFGAW
jgi:hypothetical protein